MKALNLEQELAIWSQIFKDITVDHFIFILPPADILGDAYIALGFLSAFELSHSRPVLVAASAESSAHRKAITLHGISHEKVAYLELNSFRFVSAVYTNGPFYRFLKDYEKKALTASKLAKVVHPGFGSNDIEWAAKGIPLFDLYRILLGIGPYAKFNPHAVSNTQESKAHTLFNQLRIRRGKTVVIFPDAFSLGGIGPDIIGAIICEFKLCGFDVLIDSVNENLSDLAPRIFLDLSLVVPFLNICGYAVINRSGMADILLQSVAIKCILYPNKHLQSVYSTYREGLNIVEVPILDSQDWLSAIRQITSKSPGS